VSVYKNILDAIKSQLQTYVTLTGVNGTDSIRDEAIVIRTPRYNSDSRSHEWYASEETPGILIIPGRRVRRPPGEGNNCQDDVHYPVMIQIVDRSQQRYDEDKVASWLLWHENIAKYFNHNNLRNAVFDTSGYVNRVTLPDHDFDDPQRFLLHDLCVSYLFLDVVSREPRNSNGLV